MTEKDIRPIPKNILKRIRKLDGKYYPYPDGHVRCYAYLTTWKNELVKVTVAVKHRQCQRDYRDRKYYVRSTIAEIAHSPADKYLIHNVVQCIYH